MAKMPASRDIYNLLTDGRAVRFDLALNSVALSNFRAMGIDLVV